MSCWHYSGAAERTGGAASRRVLSPGRSHSITTSSGESAQWPQLRLEKEVSGINMLLFHIFKFLQLFSCQLVSDSLWPHGRQHTSLLCSALFPGVDSNSCALNQQCYLTISSSVIPFSSCLPSFPASGSFPMSWLFASGDQSVGAPASESVLPMNIQC